MKILQMIDVPWDSGLAHYALLVSQGLKKEGHQVFVSALPGQKPWAKARRLGLKTVPLATLKRLKPLREFVRKHGVDLINAHTGSTHSLAVASVLGKPIAVVRTRTDARAVKSRVGNRFIFKHTQRIIAAADYIRDAYVKTLRLPADKVVTIYQGINLADFELKPLPKDPIIGIVARLDPVKGHRYLLEAVAILKRTYPEVQLRIVGQEENIKRHELEVIAQRLRIDQQVTFEGFKADVSRVMSDCRIGVIASVGSEAVSRVALEWMSAGRPVVATSVGCLPEIVQDGKTGRLVPPNDAPALAQAIASVLHSPAKAEAMGKAGRQAAETRFALQQFVSQTYRVYEQAVDTVRNS